MKIQCDVCLKMEASIFCSADEAALCHVCDQRVHHANKLASKHERFSLIHPSHTPLCDICREKKAVLFCQQDRAIMCRDCELPLHTGNEHTQKHNRFLLTGIKLDKICDDAKNDVNGSDQVPDFNSCSKKPTFFSTETSSSSTTMIHGGGGGGSGGSGGDGGDCSKRICGGSTSSISEYLIEELPGWHFEDFIVDSSSFDHSPFGISKSVDVNDLGASEEDVSFIDVDVFDKKETKCSFRIQEEKLGIWVPQAPTKATTIVVHGEQVNFENKGGLIQGTKQQQTSVKPTTKGNQKCMISNYDGFAVPQITTPNKRIRSFW